MVKITLHDLSVQVRSYIKQGSQTRFCNQLVHQNSIKYNRNSGFQAFNGDPQSYFFLYLQPATFFPCGPSYLSESETPVHNSWSKVFHSKLLTSAKYFQLVIRILSHLSFYAFCFFIRQSGGGYPIKKSSPKKLN